MRARKRWGSVRFGDLTLAATMFAAAACSSAAEPASPAKGVEFSQKQAPEVTLANHDAGYDVEIRSTGNGCKPGTWTASRSDDGQTYSVKFKSLSVSKEAFGWGPDNDCALQFGLRSSDGRSFSVSDFTLRVAAPLKEKDTASASGVYYFEDRPKETRAENYVNVTGPHDGDYELGLKSSGQWSSCLRNTDLFVALSTGVYSSGGRAGSTQDETSDGTPAQLEFKLAARACALSEIDAGTAPPPPVPAEFVEAGAGSHCAIYSENTGVEGVRIGIAADRCTFKVGEPGDFRYWVEVAEPIRYLQPPQAACSCARGSANVDDLVTFRIGQGWGANAYCPSCDTGCCAPVSTAEAYTLEPQVVTNTVHWPGRSWSGPSDTGTRPGAAFAPGSYKVRISVPVGELGVAEAELPIVVQ